MRDGIDAPHISSKAGPVQLLRAGFKRIFVRKNITRTAVAMCACAITYWGAIASDRYVSEANVLIEHTSLGNSPSVDIGSLLTGGATSNRADQLLLRNYLLSSDMMNKLDAKLHLRAHYSAHARDPLTRLRSEKASQEQFYRYYLTRVSAEFDDYAGILVIKAEAFDPAMAQAITATLLSEGEHYMNDIGHRLAQSQVGFLEVQVGTMAERFQQARLALLAYQSKKGLVAPERSAENDVGNINKLRSASVELQTRRTGLLAYLTPQAPGVVDLDVQIAAIDKQIAQEQGLLTGAHGDSLNRTVEQYQRLELQAMFAQDVYKTALAGLEKGRIEATRTLKKVTVLQSPTLPDEPLRPRRFYNMLTFILVTMLVAGILNLLAAIIRDHRD